MVSISALSKEKVTVSLPRDLVRYADKKAAESGKSRSQLVAEALAEKKAREELELAAEGYCFYAGESKEFADRSLGAVSEAMGNGC